MHARPGADAMGVFYVGKGRGRRSHDFRRRNPYHQHVIAKYGSDNIDVARIECSDEASAFELERGLIKCLRRMGIDLTNATEGGEGVSGLRHSDATRAKMSAERKGRSHSDETKAKMTEARSGQRNAFFGRQHSGEAKRKIAETRKANPTNYWIGKPKSEEVRRKISEALTGRVGRKHTDDAKAKISAARKERGGTSPSEETRAKLSAAVKEVWRKRKLATSGEQK
jgi:hypothetical protein